MIFSGGWFSSNDVARAIVAPALLKATSNMFLVLFSEKENPLSRKWGVQNSSKSIAPENTCRSSMLNMRSLVSIADKQHTHVQDCWRFTQKLLLALIRNVSTKYETIFSAAFLDVKRNIQSYDEEVSSVDRDATTTEALPYSLNRAFSYSQSPAQ